MAFPQQFLRCSAEIAETVRRNRRMIRQVAYLCAESQRELDDSYALLRQVERSMREGGKTGPGNQPRSNPKNSRRC
jgi:hypothetical protein